jgi:hypothetical protein
VRATATEQKYQQLCNRYPDMGNPSRQRLIAGDPEMPIPAQFEEILRWLATPPSSQRPPDEDQEKERD